MARPSAIGAENRSRTLAVAVAVGLVVGVASAAAALPAVGVVVILIAFSAILLRPREAVLGLALASPLYNLLVFNVAGVADIRVLEVLWLFAATGLLADRLIRGRTLVRPPTAFLVGLAALVAWYYVSALVTGAGLRGLVECVQTTYLAMIAYLVAAVFASTGPDKLRHWVRAAAIVLVVVLVTLVALHMAGLPGMPHASISVPGMSVEIAQDDSFVQSAGQRGIDISRLGVLNNGPVETAALMASLIPLALGFALQGDVLKADRRLATIVLAVATMVLLFTYSRAGWIVGVAGAMFLLFRSGSRRAALGLATAALLFAGALAVPSIAARVQELGDPSEGSYMAHQRLWMTAIAMAQERPVFGWGPGVYAQAANTLGIGSSLAIDISQDQPHNWVLELAADGGWTGAALGVALVGWLLLRGWRSVRGSPLWLQGLWIAVSSYVLMNLTLNTFRTETTWVWFGLLAAVIATGQASADGTARATGSGAAR
jgi:O-antigen ligase